MLINYQGQTLWIEGDQAYSVNDVKNKHAELTNKRQKLETDLLSYINVLNKTIKLKESAEQDIKNVTSELEGVNYILDRIRIAEEGGLVTPPATQYQEVEVPVQAVNQSTEEVQDTQLLEPEHTTESEDSSGLGFFRRRR